jgi:hypothetical protein
MNRLLEILLGLDANFLARDGAFALDFNPAWPGGDVVGAAVWNVLLAAAAVALVIWAYRRDGRSRAVKLSLGGLRLGLLLLLVTLLNRPVLTLTQVREEPSVVAVLVDDSISMRLRDVGDPGDPDRPTRLAAALNALDSGENPLLAELRQTHELRLYRFNRDAAAVGSLADLAAEGPTGGATQVASSVRSALSELRGQNVAGAVVLTDGRDTPTSAPPEVIEALRDNGVPVLPVPVGAAEPPPNLDVQSVAAQETAFAGDILNVAVTLRADNLPTGEPARLRLIDRATGETIVGADGQPVETDVDVEPGQPIEAELQLRTDEPGTLDLIVEAVPVRGELTEDDNRRPLQVTVLEASIAVLYVDGPPRWEFRYLKQELTRDRTVDLSVLQMSADPGFAQGGDVPIRRFPETMDELLEYDVVLMGDVDPRQFSDFQLQLISEFVAEKGGGFGMVAGPRHAPQGYIGTPIEQALPVDAREVESFAFAGGTITDGFRPQLTPLGERLGMFRFFADREVNRQFLEEDLQEIYWYARGVAAKPGVAQVLAVHPSDQNAAGRPTPLIVLGRYGAGRTLFSGIDDTWRWRYYTGESVFNTYWVQSLRWLARGRKLGQRRFTFEATRPAYVLGDQVTLALRVLDGNLLGGLGDSVPVTVQDADGVAVRRVDLVRSENEPEVFNASFPADAAGTFVAEVAAVGGEQPATAAVQVNVPALELARPQIDAAALQTIASETGGEVVPLADAGRLPSLLPSAAREVPLITERALWDAPIAMALFVLLITAEWVGRKLAGLL